MNNNNKKNREKEIEQYIVFSLDEQEYGINVMDCQEIITPEKLTNIPDSPEFVKGIINLREEIIPIVNLSDRLNLEADLDKENSKIIIVSISGIKAGLLVKNVEEIKKIEAENISDAPSITKKINQKFIKGIARTDDDLLVLLDPDSLFSQSEIEKIEKIE